MEECTVWPASTELRNLLPVYLFLTPPLVGGAPSSTLLLRAQTQRHQSPLSFPPHIQSTDRHVHFLYLSLTFYFFSAPTVIPLVQTTLYPSLASCSSLSSLP